MKTNAEVREKGNLAKVPLQREQATTCYPRSFLMSISLYYERNIMSRNGSTLSTTKTSVTFSGASEGPLSGAT